MGRMIRAGRQITSERLATGGPLADVQSGFTLVEMSTSVAVLLIVLTAAWMLLTVSNNNLNRIDYGGQASELNRAAMASFERDLGHSVPVDTETSPVLVARERTTSILVDVDNDHRPELVTWMAADDAGNSLLRVVRRLPDDRNLASSTDDFKNSTPTTSTVLTGLAPAGSTGAPLFTYSVDATTAVAAGTDPAHVGLITLHLANGLPDSASNVIDRTGAFRVIAYVINGY